MVEENDIVVVGAGPAGAAFACTLAPRYKVLLVDRLDRPKLKIGESLIPAARRLLRDMRLLDGLAGVSHTPYIGNRSFWGSSYPDTRDFITDPDGTGWHLCRPEFEQYLRLAAASRGAVLLCPAHVDRLERRNTWWDIDLRYNDQHEKVRARLVVDATGRSATVAKKLGSARQNVDSLVAIWANGIDTCETPPDAGFSTIEASRYGWWYSARVPSAAGNAHQRVLAFHTDRDIASKKKIGVGEFDRSARRLPGLGPALEAAGFEISGPLHRTAANTAFTSPVAGADWLAIGDAASSFDPLSSRGIFNALYSAFSAAMACDDALESGRFSFSDYQADAMRIRQSYLKHREMVYAEEARWKDAPFWREKSAQLEASTAAR